MHFDGIQFGLSFLFLFGSGLQIGAGGFLLCLFWFFLFLWLRDHVSSMHRCYLFLLVFQLVSRFWIQNVFLFLVAMATYVVIYNADSVSEFTTKVRRAGGFFLCCIFPYDSFVIFVFRTRLLDGTRCLGAFDLWMK